MFWTDYHGHALKTWRIDSFLGVRGASGYYTGAGPEGNAVLIQLVPEENPDSTRLRRSWSIAHELKHSHLLQVHETGVVTLSATPFFYGVFDLPEDDVAELAAREGVATERATSIVIAAASALEYLHSRGLRHGAVSLPNIVFVAGAPRLSVDALAVAGQDGCDADLRELGNAIAEMLTGQSTLGAADQLPASLRDVALACWSGSEDGWTASRVLRVATGLEPGPPAVDTVAPVRPEPASRTSSPMRLRLRSPVLALAAAGLIAGVVMLRRDTPTPRPSNIQAATRPAPATPGPKAVVEAQAAKSNTSSPLDRSGSWAVVAATYSDFGGAERRAHKLAPRLRAHVYPAHGSGNRYYVVLGSGLSSAAARKLRGRALALGAPRDTYVTILPSD